MIFMKEIKLHPCYCGGEMKIEKMAINCGMDGIRYDWQLTCSKCGLTKTYAADGFYGRKYKTFEEVVDDWNSQYSHKADKETRLDKTISDVRYILDSLILLRQIQSTGDCNVCENKDCEYIPKPGQMVRYNCPLYKSEDDACIETLDVTEREVDPNPTKPDITDYIKLLDSLPAERKKELDIVYDHWFKKVFGVDPKSFKKEEE